MQATINRRTLGTMWMLGFAYAAFGTVDVIVGAMVPITARYFTDSVTLISAMVALKRVGGMFVQPYIAWWSDRRITPTGRRRPFLLVGIPATIASMLLLGAMPHLVPADLHASLMILALVFLVDLVMDVFISVCFGASDPLFGDLFPKDQLGRASAIRGYGGIVLTLFMGWVAMPLGNHHDMLPYAGSALCLTLAWVLIIWGVREPPITVALPPSPARYNPFQHLAALREPELARKAIVASAVLGATAVSGVFQSLFVVETLKLTKADIGTAVGMATVVAALATYPIGVLVDRHGPRATLLAGFGIFALQSLGAAVLVETRTDLIVASCVGGFGTVLMWVPLTTLIFAGVPADRRGAVFGAIQMCRAGTAAVLTFAAGPVVTYFGSYRVTGGLACLCCLVGLAYALRLSPTIPDESNSPTPTTTH